MSEYKLKGPTAEIFGKAANALLELEHRYFKKEVFLSKDIKETDELLDIEKRLEVVIGLIALLNDPYKSIPEALEEISKKLKND